MTVKNKCLAQDALFLRPTFAQINLGALKSNLKKARALFEARSKKYLTSRKPKIMLLVKANAYGHGAELISSYVQKEKLCDFLAVASIEEGAALRARGIKLPILVLGSIYPLEAFEHALKNDLSVTIASVRAAKFIVSLAQKLKIKARCHVKQETGMNRIGSRKPAALEILRVLNSSPYVCVEGVYSHLSSAAEDEKYTNMQVKYFNEFLAIAEEEGLSCGIKHISASPAFIKYPKLGYDMIRLGHLAYGLEEGYKPVLSLRSKVVFIKDVRSGAGVSYGHTYFCPQAAKIATIPIGYGDGYFRCLSNKAQVLIKGVACPVIGNITMDMLMCDITALGDIPVGSEAVLIGSQGKREITAACLAKLAGTIDYEILTAISARVLRFGVLR